MAQNKLKKALLATVVGATLFGALGCRTYYSAPIYLRDPTEYEKSSELEVKGYETNYDLEDLVNTNSNVQVSVTESKYKNQVRKKIRVIPGLISFQVEKYGLPHVQSELTQAAKNVAAAYEENKEKIKELKSRGSGFHRVTVKGEEYVICNIRSESPKEEVVGELSETETVFKDKKAEKVRLIIEPANFFKTSQAIARDGVGIFEFNLPFYTAISKESLEQTVRSSKFIAEIKQEFRDYILNRILPHIKEATYTVRIVTDEVSESPKTSVTNGSINGSIKLYEVQQKTIDSTLEDFINTNINSKIKEVTIKLKDIDSHIPIEYANMEIKSNAPEKRRLAQEYFEGGLLSWATSKIDDYVVREGVKKFDETGVLRFKVYLLSSVEAEITHKNYNFLEQNFKFEEDKLAKTVYMSELGQKMRVKIVDK